MRRPWAWLAALAVLAAVVVWLGGSSGAVSSTLSRDARGWLAARRYLEAGDVDVRLRDEPLSAAGDGVLVLAFPWQTGVDPGEMGAVGELLRRGGTVVAAYSGDVDTAEAGVLAALTLELSAARPDPPLMPLAWWRYHSETWTLDPEGAWPDGPRIAVSAPRAAPEAPRNARVLYRGPDGTPLVFDYPLHRGRVLALPADALSNARLGEAGNADFLHSLVGWLGDVWSFDEYHHGLIAAGSIPASSARFAWDLFVTHLALIYLLGLAVLARRFGPAWREAPASMGSTAAFLSGVGALHHDLGHHRDAARLLIKRALAYDPALALPEALERRGREVDGAADFEAVARDVARAQNRRSLDV